MTTAHESSKTIAASKLKTIKTELAALKPQKVAVNGGTNLSVIEAIIALAPTLERMKKRGFELSEIVEKLHEKGIAIKPVTLNKYLSECRRNKKPKRDTPPPQQSIGERCAEQVSAATQGTEKNISGKDRKFPQVSGGFVVTPDIPLDEL